MAEASRVYDPLPDDGEVMTGHGGRALLLSHAGLIRFWSPSEPAPVTHCKVVVATSALPALIAALLAVPAGVLTASS